jgi:hypothetical protein
MVLGCTRQRKKAMRCFVRKDRRSHMGSAAQLSLFEKARRICGGLQPVRAMELSPPGNGANLVLVSDDWHLRNLGKTEFAIDGVWTQALLMHARGLEGTSPATPTRG